MQTPVIEQVQGEEFQEEQQAPVCRHHWVIESPHGATSFGRCKVCDEIREFRNSSADTLWEGDPMRSAGKMSGGNSRPVVRSASAVTPEE